MRELQVRAPDGIAEVGTGTDLVTLVLDHCDLADGDVVVVTSKIVSKAEGRVGPGDEQTYAEALAAESVRIVARRGPVRIVRHRTGLVHAAAGIDRSNVPAGQLALLPEDPDASARRLREGVADRTGRNVAVVVTDTAGRAWRHGQTDIAIGVAGFHPLTDHAGRTDAYGNHLAVTAPAVADELAGAAELAQGKLDGRPVAVVRGRSDLVLPSGVHGPGARALVRAEDEDLFGLGAREAVRAALRGDPADRTSFGAPVAPEELQQVLGDLSSDVSPMSAGGEGALSLRLPQGTDRTAVTALAFAHGWRLVGWTETEMDVLLHAAPVLP